ncbi:MAG: hypothetical protein JEZ11_10395 [Desulfobacterales bacterium]|nr:hypothetical protein [Desulfobacterales bacterium]
MKDSDKTVIMNTVKLNIVQGTICGISQNAFSEMEPALKSLFQNVWWDQDRLHINNFGHDQYFGTFDELEAVFGKLANAMVGSKYGKLGFIGLIGKREILAVIFFGQGKWELKEFTRPEAPEWYKSEDWYQMEKFKEDMEWDELFKRD